MPRALWILPDALSDVAVSFGMLGFFAASPTVSVPFPVAPRLLRPLRGLGGWWDWGTKWYVFQAWKQTSQGWRIVHQEGPMKLTRSQAQSRHVDIMEENWGATVYAWEWNGSVYVRAF